MLDFFKMLFKKKTETDKFILKAKKFEGTKLSCKEWVSQIAEDPNPEAFEKYCEKVIKIFDIKTLKGPNKMWSVLYGEYGEGKEPFDLDEFWNYHIDESLLDGEASNIEKEFKDFVFSKKINEKEIENNEVVLKESEWINLLEDFEKEFPFYFKNYMYNLEEFWNSCLTELGPGCEFEDFSYYVFGKDENKVSGESIKHPKMEWENIYDEFVKATGKVDTKEKKKPRKKKSTKK